MGLNTITPAQRRKIFAVARERGLDEESVREIVRQITGQSSTRGISVYAAIRIIDRLEGKQTAGFAQYDKNSNQISPRQLWKIRELEKALGWQDNPKRIEAFVRKYAKVDKLNWLTRYQAIKVIDGLKTMLARQETAV